MTATTTQATYTKAQLEKAGGKAWTPKRGGGTRYYFNGLASMLGLEVERYGTGNISNATLHGKPISNSKARQILEGLFDAKFWFDAATGKFESKGLGADDFDTIRAEVVARIEAQ